MEKSQNNVKKIFGYIFSIISLICCILITVEVISASNEARPPKIFGYSVSYVPTPSMEPYIMAGDYVLFKETTFSECGYNDVIVYRSESGMYIIHRIEEVHDGYFIVKGDNNVLPDDEHVTPEKVYAKYVTTIEALSIFSGGISKNAIFFILIIIFIILIGMQIASIVIKEKTDEINKETETEKKLLLERMRNEILQEELEKLRKQQRENNGGNE